jgi:hypothetical protein
MTKPRHVSPWDDEVVSAPTPETAATAETAGEVELPRQFFVGEHDSKNPIPVLAQIGTKTVWPLAKKVG